jgi:type I restriction enzyme, R subunit
MPGRYSEDQLVEQTALRLISGLGWQVLSGSDDSMPVLRETPSDAVLQPVLVRCLKRLNPEVPAEAIRLAAEEIVKDRATLSVAEGNREVYRLLKDGVRVSLPDKERGGQKLARIQLIDWNDATRNEFLAINQLPVTGLLYTRRPDIICFVNGLPLLVIELKKPGINVRQALDDNLRAYKSDIPQLFWSNAALIISNGLESRIGSITAGWEHFTEWKKVESEKEEPAVSLEKMLRGVCDRELPWCEQCHRIIGSDSRPAWPVGSLLAYARIGQELFHGVLCPKGAPQNSGQLDLCDHHRSHRTR